MEVSVERREEACLLVLSGEIDRGNMRRLAIALSDCMDSFPGAIIMDLEDITFIDGGGLGLIHDALDRLGERGWLGVARPLPEIQRTLGLAGLTDRPGFYIFSSLTEALQAAERDQPGSR